ncbi:MAG: sialate O-acetylesterase [Clostridia bacterium]|nr:sialate O-acetylesterase [Clostridia bacterium]
MIQDGVKSVETEICSFLMIGQSNMAGRGEFGEVPAIDNPLCYMLRMGRWQKMREPINPDRGIFEGDFHSGLSLGASFADAAAKHYGQKIGMIPCADGGTKMCQWMPGELLYDHALCMARLAMRTSKLCGILWHQGESDCRSDEDVALHRERFVTMIGRLRRDLGMPDLPVVIGELSYHIGERWKTEGRHLVMNAQYHELATDLPNCTVVSAAGLTMKKDEIHFNSASLREFGKRYFEGYLNLIKPQ